MADSELNIRITAQDKASATINNVGKSVGALGKDLGSVQQTVSALASGNLPALGRSFSSLSGLISGSAGAMGLLASGVGAAAGALGGMAIQAANAVEQLDNMAAQTGLAARDLEALQRIAEDMGLGTDTLATSIGNLNRQLAIGEETAFGSALRKLGVSATDAAGGAKDAITVLEELQAALKAIPDPAERSQAAAAALGRGMRELIPLILNSSKGIRELIGDMQQSGRVMDEVTRQNFRDLDEGLDLLNAGWQELKNGILSAIGSLAGFVTKWKQDIPPMAEDIAALTLAWAKWEEEQRRARGGAAAVFPPSPFRAVPPEELEARARAIAGGATGRELEIKIKLEELEKKHAQALKDKNYVEAIGIAQQIAGYKQQLEGIEKANKALEAQKKKIEDINDELQKQFGRGIRGELPAPPMPIQGPLLFDPAEMADKMKDFQYEVQQTRFQARDLTKKDLDTATKDAIDSAEAGVKRFYDLQQKAREEHRRQWEKMIDTIRDGAGEVFDAMLTKGESVFSSLAKFAEGGLQTMLRNVFQNAMVSLASSSGILQRLLGGGGGGFGGGGGGAGGAGALAGGAASSGLGAIFGGLLGGGGAAAATGGMGAFLGAEAAATTTATTAGGGLFGGLFGGGAAGAAGLGGTLAAGAATAGIAVAAMLATSYVAGLFQGGEKRRAEEKARRAGIITGYQFAAPETITRYALAGEVGAVETDLTGRVRGIGRVPTVVVNVSNQMIDARHAREAGAVIGQEVSRQILAGGSYLADNIAWAAS